MGVESAKPALLSRIDCPTSCASPLVKKVKVETMEKPNETHRPTERCRKEPETWKDVFLAHAKATPELMDIQKESENLVPGRIIFQLPGLGASAGKVLTHAVRVLETLFKNWDPLIFKVGWSHHPVWRWNNAMYGYGHSRDRWTQMIVVYFSLEPHGPAMLEAALIDKFSSTLVKTDSKVLFSTCLFFLM